FSRLSLLRLCFTSSFLLGPPAPRDRPSFPTRRSSDLGAVRLRVTWVSYDTVSVTISPRAGAHDAGALMSDAADTGIQNLSEETRSFSPPSEFVQNAVARPSLYEEADRDPVASWRARARLLSWKTPFTETLDWSNPPFARWFADGTLNAAYNCVDRHVESGHGEQVAFLAEYEDGSDASFTYAEVKDEI